MKQQEEEEEEENKNERKEIYWKIERKKNTWI